ncbi:MAG: hypothetical protein ABW026_10775 [Microvirga sp.]
MSDKTTGVRVAATCVAALSSLAVLGPGAAGPSDYRPIAWHFDLKHLGETLPSDWSPPAGQTILQPFAMPTSKVTARAAFEVPNEGNCPEYLFGFHAGRVGVDLSAPHVGFTTYFVQAHAPHNVHLLTLQAPRCRITLRISKAIRDGDGTWHRVAVWSRPDPFSQNGGPGPFPSQPVIDVTDPEAQEAARQRFTVERRAWEKRLNNWHDPREKALMDEMRQRDPARATAVDEKRWPHEFSDSGYMDEFWFTDTNEPCFEASGYMEVGPSGLRLTYRPLFQRADPLASPSGSESLVPFGASITYNDADTAATLTLYSPTCRLEIGIDEEIRTTSGWVSAPVKHPS